jgi:hypothetical protein
VSEGTRGPNPPGQAPQNGGPPRERSDAERSGAEELATSRGNGRNGNSRPPAPAPRPSNGSSAQPTGTTPRAVPWRNPTVSGNGQATAKPATDPQQAAAGASVRPAPAAAPKGNEARPPQVKPAEAKVSEVKARQGGPDFTAPVARPQAGSTEAPSADLPVDSLSSETKPANKLSFRERLGFAKKDETPGAPQDAAPVTAERTQASAAAAAAPPAPQARTIENPGPAAPTGTPAVTPGAGLHTDTAEIPAVPASVTPVPAHPPEQLAAGAKPKPGAARRTRKARLRLSRLDPWSVMKTSFLFSIAAGIMLVVAVYVVWTVIGASSLFDSVNEIVKSVVSTPGDTTPFRIQEYINTQKVMGVAALLACVDVVIFTALATLGSFLYNLAATMLGGLEITLAED